MEICVKVKNTQMFMGKLTVPQHSVPGVYAMSIVSSMVLLDVVPEFTTRLIEINQQFRPADLHCLLDVNLT
jgi:hypothetical protein